MNKVYLVPVKRACNANCTFCISKEYSASNIREVINLHNEEVIKNLQKSFKVIKDNFKIEKFEVTGGGEPFLNNYLQDIIDTIKMEFSDIYIKLYSNGFILQEIKNVDELNISRSHYDSVINNKVYLSKKQNDLEETLKFFRPMVKELRLCTVMMKDIMDTKEEYQKMVDKLDYLIDTFVLRPLIPEKESMKDQIVHFDFHHPKLKKDEIDCFCHKHLVIGPDGKLYEDFNFNNEFSVSDTGKISLN